MRALAAIVLLGGCAAQAGAPAMKCPTLPVARQHSDPPPVSQEAAARVVLAPGHWDWVDGAYVWIPPAWVPRPNQRAEKSGRIWQDGFWSPAGLACVWNPGRFLF